MTGLIWYVGQEDALPNNPDAARITDGPIRSNDSATEPIAAPDWNEFESDDSSELTGLSPREKASYFEPSQQYIPFTATANENHNEIVDNQVSTSGTAAAREAAGVYGHGTMQTTIGIEPVIRDGAAFGNDYFTRGAVDIQDGAGNYMTPAESDNWAQAVAQANATASARQAAMDSLYASFLQN